jgi:RNase P/RNase MRP subunit p30
MDIVFPKGNEEKFIEVSKKIGFDSLCFVYTLNEFSRKNFDVKYGVLCSEKEIIKAKRLSNLIFVKAPENPRKLIEGCKNVIIFDFEQNFQKDFLHQKRTGLNHILCSLCAKNDITIGFSFRSFLEADLKQRNVLIGRMMANIKLCLKYNVKMMFGSFANEPYDMRSIKDLESFFHQQHL